MSLYAEEKLKQNLFDSRFLYLVQSSSISHQVDKEEEHPGDEVNYFVHFKLHYYYCTFSTN